MSFGFSDRIKRILGFQDQPMENEVPGYLEGADFQNTQGFTGRDLKKETYPQENKPDDAEARRLAAREADQRRVGKTYNEGNGETQPGGAWKPSGGGSRGKFTQR